MSINLVDAELGNKAKLMLDMPANVTTWDFGLAVGNKWLASIPHPDTAIVPIIPRIPVSLAVAIAVVTSKNEKHFNFYY